MAIEALRGLNARPPRALCGWGFIPIGFVFILFFFLNLFSSVQHRVYGLGYRLRALSLRSGASNLRFSGGKSTHELQEATQRHGDAQGEEASLEVLGV